MSLPWTGPFFISTAMKKKITKFRDSTVDCLKGARKSFLAKGSQTGLPGRHWNPRDRASSPGGSDHHGSDIQDDISHLRETKSPRRRGRTKEKAKNPSKQGESSVQDGPVINSGKVLRSAAKRLCLDLEQQKHGTGIKRRGRPPNRTHLTRRSYISKGSRIARRGGEKVNRDEAKAEDNEFSNEEQGEEEASPIVRRSRRLKGKPNGATADPGGPNLLLLPVILPLLVICFAIVYKAFCRSLKLIFYRKQIQVGSLHREGTVLTLKGHTSK